MTCKDCLMFTHCRYDLERNGEPCENFKNKNKFVEVVRCKECLFSKPTATDGILACIRKSAYKKPTDYCSSGERKKIEVE